VRNGEGGVRINLNSKKEKLKVEGRTISPFRQSNLNNNKGLDIEFMGTV